MKNFLPFTVSFLSRKSFVPGHGESVLIRHNGGNGFFSLLTRLMKEVQDNRFQSTANLPGSKGPIKKKVQVLLRALEEEFLSAGKPVPNISLDSSNFPLLQEFLHYFGLSKHTAESILKDLSENNPGKKIGLLDFLEKIAILAEDKKKQNMPFVIDPSVIPYLESTLRSFGFAPKELETAFNSAKIKGRGAHLGKLLGKLKALINKRPHLKSNPKLQHFLSTIKELATRQPLQSRGSVSDRSTPALLEREEKHVNPGSKGRRSKRGGLISVRDLVKTLELLTRNPGKGLPEKVVANSPGWRFLEGAIQPFSKTPLDTQPFIKKATKKEKASSTCKTVNSMEGKGKPKSADTRASLKPTVRNKEIEFSSDWEGNQIARIESGKKLPTLHNSIGSIFLKPAIQAGENARLFRPSLPTYLINQVGRSISKAVLRGEKVIRLRLKPPSLGTLNIKINIKDNKLKLEMASQKGAAKDLLLSHVNELKSALWEQGLKLERIDIQVNESIGYSLANSEQDTKGELGKYKRGAKQPVSALTSVEEGAEEHPWAGRSITTGQGLLDLIA
ncbi:MAG: hypothetical protein DRH11_00330 [Deltaproteobacteria bacterium]|nr:MAG: hypothetical protein DRH11_00330 [Deltaproteobacteria bacterium]